MLSVAQTIQQKIDKFSEGQIFDYQVFFFFFKSPEAVVKAVNRLVEEKKIERLEKGKFYIPKKTVLGLSKPSDSELIRSEIYKNGQLRGYVTGMALHNQLGLTTQIPRTITIAFNGGRQIKDFGTIRIRKISTNVPITKRNVKLLQYLDVLKDIKKISGSDINQSLVVMSRYLSGLNTSQQKELMRLAVNFYGPQARAIVGLLFNDLEFHITKTLSDSLNPVTVYKLYLDDSIWPKAIEWNIR